MKKVFFIGIFLTLLTLTCSFIFPNFFEAIEAKWVDIYFKIRGPLSHENQIILIAIDEKSITKLGRWPWPRSVMANLIEKLTNHGVKTLGLDITFSEVTLEDSRLASALRKSPNAFLGYFFYLTEEEVRDAHLSKKEIFENEQSIYPSQLSISSKQLETSGRKVYGVQTNVPEISKSLEGNRQGFFNVFPDTDGVIRFNPLILFYKGNVYPSLSLQMASHAVGFSPIPLFSNAGVLEGLALGNIKIPLSPTGEFFINYRGVSKTFSHISIADVLENQVPKGILQDKIALIGASAIGIYDMRVTPLEANFAGPEIHLHVIDNILKGDFLVSNLTTKMVAFFLLIFTGLFLSIVTSKLRALPGLFVFLAFMTFLLGLGYYLFASQGVIIHNFKPSLNGILVYGGITIYRYFTEERERRKIKKTFQHYLSPAVIKVLLEHPEQLKLGGERKELTVLFSDIRGFTSKSEKLPPEKIVQLLNDYFTVMTDIVFKYEGTVDKYMGDAIMAIFGAPLEQSDHPLKGSLTALEMVAELKKTKKDWCQKYGIDDLQIGIGIHTGPMAIGNMGSLKRFNYTVIGDSVNLASRLEGLNKEYGTQIIVSEAHYEKVRDHVTAKKLGDIRVRGKEETVAVYELLGKIRDKR